MKKLLILCLSLILGIHVYGQVISSQDDFVLIDGYLYANKIGDSDKSIANSVYKPGSIFTFNYKYIDTTGKEMFFIIKKYGEWDFTETNRSDENVVKEFKLEVQNNNRFYRDLSFYQTNILYRINKNETTTGLIENEFNIWLHPPREYLFRILELNPFPYIKSPIAVGNSWEWKLQIGAQWGDKRWKEWSGNIENKYRYKITGKEELNTNFGSIECYVVESQAVSELGVTKLKSYFNERYGFVRLEYTNIDNSKIEMNLQKAHFQVIDDLKLGL